MLNQVAGLLAWLAICFSAATIGAVASRDAGQFYGQLTRPDWAPPSWAFGPVWTLLYILMAVAAWLVWRKGGIREARGPLALFLVQLVLNALWTWLFFRWQRGALAFADSIVLWVLILATLIAFWRVRPLAGVLLIPYLMWVTFATVLTFAVWRLNPQSFT